MAPAARAYALELPQWGHRKIAALMRADGHHAPESTVLRALRDAELTLPAGHLRQSRKLAGARREAFLEPPSRRNRVWQTDFTELETSGGGTWQISPVCRLRHQALDRLPGHRDRALARRRRRPGGSAGRRRGPARPQPAGGLHRLDHRRAHAGDRRHRQRLLLQGRRLRALHRLPPGAHARAHEQEEPAHQRRRGVLQPRLEVRRPLPRPPGRRPRPHAPRRRPPRPLQQDPPARAPRLGTAPRSLPRRADHTNLRARR